MQAATKRAKTPARQGLSERDRIPLLLAVLVLGFGLGGCGSDDPGTNQDADLPDVVGTTADEASTTDQVTTHDPGEVGTTGEVETGADEDDDDY